MKVRIEIDETLEDEEIVIRCRQLDDRIQKIQQFVSKDVNSKQGMVVKKEATEYYIPFSDILFFETEKDCICAHTVDRLFTTEYRLYELEELLPGFFLRVSKSTIINLNHVYSITKNITASSAVEFIGTHKQVYVSRHYFKILINRLDEKWRKGEKI